MRAFVLAVFAAVLSLSFAPGARAQAYDAPGPYQVVVSEGVWHDAKRDRDVPYLIRYPDHAPGALPVVIFSHGLGGSAHGAGYYGDHLASHGFVVVYVQHPGSDVTIWRSVLKPGQPFSLENVDTAALAQTVKDPKITINRFMDIYFALNQLAAMNAADGPLKGRLDLGRVGMSGHSFGAVTTQAMAGQVYPNGMSMPRTPFKAFLAMSPSGAADGNDARAFAPFDRPFLFMTGTKDDFTIKAGETGVAEKRLRPYEAMTGAPASLMVLTGGDHLVFSGREELGRSLPMDARDHSLIKAASLAFWLAYLKGDDAALHWLRDGGLKAMAGADARVESKGPSR